MTAAARTARQARNSVAAVALGARWRLHVPPPSPQVDLDALDGGLAMEQALAATRLRAPHHHAALRWAAAEQEQEVTQPVRSSSSVAMSAPRGAGGAPEDQQEEEELQQQEHEGQGETFG